MHIHKVEIYNFRSHKETVVELSKDINVLIGPNNTGKTSFLHALNLALGYKKFSPSEDDFYAEGENFDPKNSEPIRVILEFREREIPEEKFSDNVVGVFENAIQFDEEVSDRLDEPIKYFRICYECKFDKEKDRFIEERYFVDKNNQKIKARGFEIRKDHLSFIPFFYLQSIRDINREIKSRTSFWGKIKSAIDYTEKKEEIKELVNQINELLLKKDETVEKLMTKLRELENNIKVTPDAISLHAFTQRSWELLDDLNIYLKLPKANLSLPISKHGAGTQNIMILLIFTAYLEILLPKIVENPEAMPIIGIEEPEAHVHPHAQRALLHQISKIKGQKIISTHSPYIVEQASIYDYIVFNLENGVTKVSKIPLYKKSFTFKYGLPEALYENNKFLTKDEELKIKRYIQFKNPELFFSSLFILCEGDSEKIFLEQITPYYLGKTPGQLGISIIPCEGQTYSPFLKIANKGAFDLKWIILSDGEENTRNNIKRIIRECGYNYDDIKNKICYLPQNQDFEKYYISFYGTEKMKEIIKQFYGNKAFEIFKKSFEKEFKLKKEGKNIDDFTEEQLINIFIDRKGKPKFAEQLSQSIINNRWKVPKLIVKVLDKAKNEVEIV